MISRAELSHHLAGCLRLMRLDPNGLAYFQGTEQGFWRSCLAVALMLPILALLMTGGNFLGMSMEFSISFWFSICALYTCSWFSGMILSFFFAQKYSEVGKEGLFQLFSVLNWSELIFRGVEIVLMVMILSGVLTGGGMVSNLFFTLMILSMLFSWFIIRLTLKTSELQSAGLVIAQLMLGALWSVLFIQVHFAFTPPA